MPAEVTSVLDPDPVLDPDLVRRLWRPVERPGLIDPAPARAMATRHQRMVAGLPLADLVSRYTGSASDLAGTDLPIVYALPSRAPSSPDSGPPDTRPGAPGVRPDPPVPVSSVLVSPAPRPMPAAPTPVVTAGPSGNSAASFPSSAATATSVVTAAPGVPDVAPPLVVQPRTVPPGSGSPPVAVPGSAAPVVPQPPVVPQRPPMPAAHPVDRSAPAPQVSGPAPLGSGPARSASGAARSGSDHSGPPAGSPRVVPAGPVIAAVVPADPGGAWRRTRGGERATPLVAARPASWPGGQRPAAPRPHPRAEAPLPLVDLAVAASAAVRDRPVPPARQQPVAGHPVGAGRAPGGGPDGGVPRGVDPVAQAQPRTPPQSGAPVDVERIVDAVHRRFVRRLAVEAERRAVR